MIGVYVHRKSRMTEWRCYCFFNDTATTEIYTLSLHDALPICAPRPRSPPRRRSATRCASAARRGRATARPARSRRRSEEHTSELQSRQYLVCRLLLEKKKIDRHFCTNPVLVLLSLDTTYLSTT